MKYSIFDSEDEAKAENIRLMELFGIPDGKGALNYSRPELRDGKWILRVKESGPWKADDIALNVQDIEPDTVTP